MSDAQFTVMIHHDLVNQLEDRLSPFDEIVAIDQMFLELPTLHPTPSAKRSHGDVRRRLKAYWGRYEWSGLNFTYVQLGPTLHVLDLWSDGELKAPRRKKPDVILGSGPVEKYYPDEAPK